MTAAWLRRSTARTGALTFLAATSLFLTATSADARSGTWGAAHSPYLDGLVCPTGTQTTPLASWDFGTGTPAFLTAPVLSDGVTDSAALPFADAGPQIVTPVVPGALGFTTSADVATYAQLISRFGGGDAGQVAAVARAVMLHATPDVPDCAGAGDAAGLLARAAAAAGPYSISVVSSPRTVVPGDAATVTATVRGAAGPANGLPVTFASSDLGLHSSSATTDSSGRASMRFTAPAGTGGGPFDITASVTAPVGLVQITSTAAPMSTDPGGATAVAVAPAEPRTVTGHANVDIDPSAHPTVSAGFDAGAVAVGRPVVPRATVHDLRGHTATVDLAVVGPLPFDPDGRCRAVAFTDATPTVYTTDPITTAGDATVQGTAWTPDRAGCYAARARVTTVDAVPEATATSQPAGSGLTVIRAALVLTVPHPVVGAGRMTVRAVPTYVGGTSPRLLTRLVGPVAPGAAGSCGTADWASADRSAVLRTTLTRARPGRVQGPGRTTPGCYRFTTTMLVDLDGSTVPVAAVSPPVLLVRPVISLTSDRTWTISPRAVTTHVTVSGTYGLAAHVSLRLRYAARPDTGCRSARWAGTPLGRPGPGLAVTTTARAVAVASGPTIRTGCYLPVATLVLDSNRAVSVTSTPPTADNAVLAGLGEQPRAAPVTYRIRPSSSSPLLATGIVVGIVNLIIIVSIVVVARTSHTRAERG